MVAWSPGGLRGGGPSATGACYQNGTATARAKTAGSSTTVRSESRARNFKLTHYPAFQGLKLIRTCSPRVSPRLRASASRSIPPLDAIPTRTEQSASRYVRAIADGGSAPHRESVQRPSPGAESPRFHHFRGLQVHLLPSRFLGRETEETFNIHTASTFFSSSFSTGSRPETPNSPRPGATLESETCISHPNPAPNAASPP